MIGKQLFSRVAARQVRFLPPASMRHHDALTGEVERQIANEIRLMVPPLLMHVPTPPALAACWMLIRETLLANGVTDRMTKEAVAAAVSAANSCPYCLEMHAIGVLGLGSRADADAIAADTMDAVADPELRAVVHWARQAGRRDLVGSMPPPYSPEAGPELVGVAVAFHYLTRMVNIYLPDYLLPPALRGGARRQVKGRIARMLEPVLRSGSVPGTSLRLLPDAPLPADCAWAAGSPHVSAAMAKVSATFDAVGARSLSQPVRELLLARLDQWHGEDMGPSRGWLDAAVAPLSEVDRPVGRVVMLAAFASYQLVAEDVNSFRAVSPDAEALVSATAWASFSAARRVGSWHTVLDTPAR